eukprot:jgi/Ulvmu1/12269/UM087_0002.1
MPEQEDIKMRVAASRRSIGSDVPASPGPSSSAHADTEYNRKLAKRQYSRNMRFAKQFREFATGNSPKSPLRVQIDEGGDSVHDKLLPPESSQADGEISAEGGGPPRRDPGHLATFLSRSQGKRNEASMRAMRRRMRRIILAGITVALAAAAAVVAWHDGEIDGYHTWLGVPFASWLVLAAAVTPAVLLARYAMALLVRLLESVATAVGLSNVHYVLVGVTDALKLFATAAVWQALVVVIIAIREHPRSDPMAALAVLSHMGSCLVVFAAVELCKTLSCRLLSLRVNSGDLFDMLQDAIDKEVIMNRLMAKRHTHDTHLTPQRTAAIARCRGIPEWAVAPYLNDLYALALTTAAQPETFTDYLVQLGNRFQNMSEEEANESASHAAEYFWLTLRQDPDSEDLTYEDLLRVLEDEGKTAFVFSAFDIDGDGCVQEHELHARVQKCYQERRNVALTLMDNDEVIRTLQALVGAVLHAVAVFAYLFIFGVDIRHVLISLSSMGLAFVFVFGNNLRAVYESLVFLFMIRPYQVGDCVRYHGELHWVKNFGLLTTQFSRFDGCRIWIPNEVLMRSEITNLSQSSKLRVRAAFEVDAAAVTPVLCEELAEQLLAMMEARDNAHLFSTDFEPLCHIEHLANPLKYKVGLCYQLSCTGEKYVEEWEANSRVNHTVGLWLQAHGIEHSTSVQPLYAYEKKKTA